MINFKGGLFGFQKGLRRFEIIRSFANHSAGEKGLIIESPEGVDLFFMDSGQNITSQISTMFFTYSTRKHYIREFFIYPFNQEILPLLDAGHGYYTKGKRSKIWDNGTQLIEYLFNIDLREKIADILDELGVKYKYLIESVFDIHVRERARIADRISEDSKIPVCIVSLHANGSSNPEGKGFETFTAPGFSKSDIFATMNIEALQKYFPEFKFRLDFSDGDPDKERKFGVLLNKEYAYLVEHLFFTNPKESQLLLNREFRKKLALADAEGILKMVGYCKEQEIKPGNVVEAIKGNFEEIDEFVIESVRSAGRVSMFGVERTLRERRTSKKIYNTSVDNLIFKREKI